MTAAYATGSACSGPRHDCQTVLVGVVQWRYCVTVCFSDEGLYLHVKPPLHALQPVLIPWAQLYPVRNTLLYWRRATTYEVAGADTRITMYDSLWAHALPYMSATRPGESK